tara:strand:- start:29 stop:394 length:366 start_codon:yes stop_codon:yes gene_type:complete
MNILKVIGYGVLIWVLMFAIVSAFVAFTIYENVGAQVILAIISGAIAFFFAGKVKPSKFDKALIFGLIWVIIGLALDALITTKFNEEIFRTWSLWLGYALVIIAPILRIRKGEQPEPVSSE